MAITNGIRFTDIDTILINIQIPPSIVSLKMPNCTIKGILPQTCGFFKQGIQILFLAFCPDDLLGRSPIYGIESLLGKSALE